MASAPGQPTVLLILPTGTYRAEEYLAAAARLGARVVVGSERRQALADKMGNRSLQLALEDPDKATVQIVEHSRRVRLDAVVAVDDLGLLTAAKAAARLGLPGNPEEAVRRTRDKVAMRRAFAHSGVPQPRFEVATAGDLDGVADAARRIGPPVVVKPAVLSGSRGVIRADSPQEAVEAAVRVSAILEAASEPPGGELLIEAYVAGAEVAVEGIVSSSRLEVVTIFDKPEPLVGPFFEETIYVAPSGLASRVAEAVEEATAAAVRSIGLTEGPVHAELRVPDVTEDGQGVAVLEVAARTIGGRCSKAVVLEGGATLEELVVARALALDGPPPRLAGPCGVLMIPIPGSGTFAGLDGVEEVRALEHVTGVEVTAPLGQKVLALPEGDRYLGFVFAAAPRRRAAEEALRRAMTVLKVRIEPETEGDETPGTLLR